MLGEILLTHSPFKSTYFATVPVWKEQCQDLTVLQGLIEKEIDLSMYFHFNGVFKK